MLRVTTRSTSRRRLRTLVGCVLVSVLATGCGAGSTSASPSARSSSKTSASSSVPVRPATRAGRYLAALDKRIAERGAGRFTQTIGTVDGKVLTSITGRYSLRQGELSATIRTPDGTSKSPVPQARVAMVGPQAYLQVAQWKRPSRGCWLRTTAGGLSTDYLLDLANAEEVPTAAQLIDAFHPVAESGGGVLSGTVEITAVLPLLTGSAKQQLQQARPKGVVETFLTVSGDQVLFTVPGYALSKALSSSLQVDESQFSSIAAVRYEAGLILDGRAANVSAPAKSKQMSAADLKANRCG